MRWTVRIWQLVLVALIVLPPTLWSFSGASRSTAQQPPASPTAAPPAPPILVPNPPGPGPGPSLSICSLPVRRVAGGTTVTLQNIAIDLPVGRGDFLVQPVLVEGGSNQLIICYVAGMSTLAFNASTGAEVARDVRDLSASAILNEIAAAVRVSLPQSTTAPAPPSASPSRSTAVNPPSTGDGGLAR
jgi:hypothetical protein